MYLYDKITQYKANNLSSTKIKMSNLFTECYTAIMTQDIQEKCNRTEQICNKFKNNELTLDKSYNVIFSIPVPGRPEKPILVPPFNVPKRRVGSKEGHAGLIHSLAHIEFNAINLALDACYRFQEMPKEFYLNWLQVAIEEVHHFKLLNAHLHFLGFSYGAFAAHNGLWSMAVKTESDALARMALVPRTLEARGIDAVPEMQEKLRSTEDVRAIEILDIIHRDEIKHVQYGDKWFKYICNQRNLDVEETFFKLLDEYNAPKIRGAFNRKDRKIAGFNDSELDRLYNMSGQINEQNFANSSH